MHVAKCANQCLSRNRKSPIMLVLCIHWRSNKASWPATESPLGKYVSSSSSVVFGNRWQQENIFDTEFSTTANSLNRESKISPEYNNYIPNFEDQITSNYSPSALRAETMTKLEPIAIIGPRNTQRMQAQLGVFTVIHREATPVENVGDGHHVRKLLVPSQAKEKLRNELSLLSFNRFQLFPDLENLGELLKGELNV